MNITLFVFLIIFFASGIFISNAFAQLENNVFLLEGSGYAVNDESIKTIEIDAGISSHEKIGSSINLLIEDGFFTLENEDFVISELEGKFLREGRYIRINGNVENFDGSDTTISFFGRLVEESKDAAIYGFTGRITATEESYKIIYTAKISNLTKKFEIIDVEEKEKTLKIRILPGSSLQGVANSYIESGKTRDPRISDTNPIRLGYFSQDRITIEPGTTVTFVNEDSVIHRIISGKENYGDRHNPFTPDGRISSEEILPGKSISVPFDEMGFYRLYDPKYPWMKIVVYSFPNIDNLILGTTKNQQGN